MRYDMIYYDLILHNMILPCVVMLLIIILPYHYMNRRRPRAAGLPHPPGQGLVSKRKTRFSSEVLENKVKSHAFNVRSMVNCSSVG